jgi:hypothetical protein
VARQDSRRQDRIVRAERDKRELAAKPLGVRRIAALSWRSIAERGRFSVPLTPATELAWIGRALGASFSRERASRKLSAEAAVSIDEIGTSPAMAHSSNDRFTTAGDSNRGYC